MPHVSHPDGRPYPWLTDDAASTHDDERFLIYQPFAGMCNAFSCLECAVAFARILGRTLVLPRWRPQYGWPWLGSSADYFSVEKLHELCQAITIDEFEARRPTAGVHLCRIFLEYNPTWSDPQGFELYPALKSLLVDLEYFAEIGLDHASDERISLARPLRGSREVAAQFARIDAPVLALDHAFNVVALPSVLDAGERQILLGALRPCERLRRRLSDFTSAIERPCLAAHVRRTDHWRLAKLMGDERFWPGIDDFVRQIEATMRDRRLRACGRPDHAQESAAARFWLCFKGRRSMTQSGRRRPQHWRVQRHVGKRRRRRSQD